MTASHLWRRIASTALRPSIGAAVLLLAAACDALEPRPADRLPTADEAVDGPEPFRGTLGELCDPVNDAGQKIRGIGLVVGLGENGHSNMHPAVREEITRLITKRLRTNSAEGSHSVVKIQRLLEDPDTAVVIVEGELPPGVRRGDRFDLDVKAWPNTDTKTLEGGILFTADLKRVAMVGGFPIQGFVMARGAGMLFDNPLADNDADRRKAGANARTARVIGGGIALADRKIILRLRDPNLRNCLLIRDRINEAFQEARQAPVATARAKDYNVELAVPLRWRDDLDRFLDVILHLPRSNNPGTLEKRAKRLCEMLRLASDVGNSNERAGPRTVPAAAGPAKPEPSPRVQPRSGTLDEDVDLERISLALQGIGKAALPWIAPLLKDRRLRDEVRLAAAEAAAHLGDPDGVAILGDYAFARGVSPRVAPEDRLAWQERAVRDLAICTTSARSGAVLQDVMRRHESLRLRIMAYEALRRRGDRSIRTIRVVQKITDKGEARIFFDLDLVPRDPAAQPLIYATQRDESRIALFGPDIALERGTEFISDREIKGRPRLALFPAAADSDRTSVLMWTRSGARAPEQTCSRRLADLIPLLGGTPPDTGIEEVAGLGMGYSEIVGLLFKLTRGHPSQPAAVPALFELQPAELEPPQLVVRGRRNLDPLGEESGLREEDDVAPAEPLGRDEGPVRPRTGRPGAGADARPGPRPDAP